MDFIVRNIVSGSYSESNKSEGDFFQEALFHEALFTRQQLYWLNNKNYILSYFDKENIFMLLEMNVGKAFELQHFMNKNNY